MQASTSSEDGLFVADLGAGEVIEIDTRGSRVACPTCHRCMAFC
jgi:hypothetical protein